MIKELDDATEVFFLAIGTVGRFIFLESDNLIEIWESKRSSDQS